MQLNEMKNKYNQDIGAYQLQISQLNNQLNISKAHIDQLIQENNNLKINQNNNINNINNINQLIQMMNDLNNNQKNDNFVALHIKTADNLIDECLSFSLDEKFINVMSRIYEKFPNKFNCVNNFLYNGNVINNYMQSLREIGFTRENDGEVLMVVVRD